jgi:threonine dehydrogenase-like Zn-dependent dehydrogenase
MRGQFSTVRVTSALSSARNRRSSNRRMPSSTRPGGHVGYVGVAHGVELPGTELFFAEIHLHGGPAPVCRSLPGLIDLTLPLNR